MLEIRNLTCGYDSKFFSKDINFVANSKEFIGIIGPNGNLEIYVDGKLAGHISANDKIYIPNELMGDLQKGNYDKPYLEPRSNLEPSPGFTDPGEPELD